MDNLGDCKENASKCLQFFLKINYIICLVVAVHGDSGMMKHTIYQLIVGQMGW